MGASAHSRSLCQPQARAKGDPQFFIFKPGFSQEKNANSDVPEVQDQGETAPPATLPAQGLQQKCSQETASPANFRFTTIKSCQPKTESCLTLTGNRHVAGVLPN